jgi:hypothetical protein
MHYTAKHSGYRLKIDGNDTGRIWTISESIKLAHYMGKKPSHFPEVEAKICYDDQGIIVFFNVRDQYVKAVHTKYQDNVYKDSCVEFFFTPGKNRNLGYFNLEMNCAGTALFHFTQNAIIKKVKTADFRKIDIYHTLPEIIETEIKSRIDWRIEYKIPFEILEHYTNVSRPKVGEWWLMNLYKCADETSHPHWLTWAPVNHPQPNFHLPEFFARLYFA